MSANVASRIEASPVRVGRIAGILMLLHLIVGLMVPFMILDFVRGQNGFLFVAPENAGPLRVAVFLLFAGSAMAMAISIVVFPVIERNRSGWALWLAALAVAAFSLQVVDNGRLLTMLSLSQHYLERGSGNPDLYRELAYAAGAARRWAHYTYLFVAVTWIFALFAALFRLGLVPRALTLIGMLCALMQIGAVSIRAMLSYPPEMRLAVPLGPVYFGLAIWLIAKGFREESAKVERTKHYPLSTAVL